MNHLIVFITDRSVYRIQSDQTEMFYRIQDTVIIDGIGDVVGDLFHIVTAVAHDDAGLNIFDHIQVVVFIAEGHRFVSSDIEVFHDGFNAFHFAGRGKDDVGSTVVPE